MKLDKILKEYCIKCDRKNSCPVGEKDNECFERYLRIYQARCLSKIAGSLKYIADGDEAGDLTLHQHIQDINKSLCEISDHITGA